MASSSTWCTPRAAASCAASVVFPDPEHPTTETRRMSALLLGRPDQDFVDRDPARPGHGEPDGLGDVLCLHDLDPPERLGHALQDLGAVLKRQLRCRGTWFDQRDPHMARRHLLTQ